MPKRKRTKPEVEAQVLTRSKRICCLCFAEDKDSSRKDGQIAHLDRDPAKSREDNLVYLCAVHHGQYDRRSRQLKGYPVEQVRRARETLYGALERRDGAVVLKIKLDRPYDSFDAREQEEFVRGLKQLLKLGDVEVIGKCRGCLELMLTLDGTGGESVCRAFDAGELTRHGILNVERVDIPGIEYSVGAGISRSPRTDIITLTQGEQVLRGTAGEYKILSRLGSGAFGQTYLTEVVVSTSERITKGQHVAIKLPPILGEKYTKAKREEFLAQVNQAFQKEYRACYLLTCIPSAVCLLDCGTRDVPLGLAPVPCFFVVYEFISGPQLDSFMRKGADAATWRGLDSAGEFFEWARKLTKGLDWIHQAGVVHGDIWPPNIMLRSNGEPVYIDFGQAALRDAVLAATPEVKSHGYLAPERERLVVGDMFSLCGVLFFLATGREPNLRFEDNDELKDATVRALKDYNPRLQADGDGIADIISRGLRHNKDERIQNCAQLMEEIELFADTLSASRPVREELDNAFSAVQMKIPRLVSNEPLFARMVARRLYRLDRSIEDMLKGVQDIQGEHDTLVMTLAQYLAALEPGDHYLTATFPLAWRKDNFGVNGRFLSKNKQIIKGGVTLRRVFVVTQDELSEPWVMSVLRAHCTMLNEIDEETTAKPIQTKEKDPQHGGVFTGVLPVSEEDREKLFSEHPHAGIWIRGPEVKLALPQYHKDTGVMRGIRLRPGDASAEGKWEAFRKTYLDPAVEIRSFLAQRFGGQGTGDRPTGSREYVI